MAFKKLALTRGLVASKGFLKIFSLSLMGLFFVYLILSSAMVAYQEKDPSLFLKNIGEEMSKPIEKAQASAQDILNSEKTSLGASIWKYWGFLFNIYKLYLWFWAFSLLVGFLLRGTNSPIIIYLITALIFFPIMELYNVAILGQELGSVLKTFGLIFKALLKLII